MPLLISNASVSHVPRHIGGYLVLKRVLDVTLVLAAAPVVLPMVTLLSILVMRDGGAPFYSQTRVGRNGRMFRLWKLRSMVPDAEEALGHLMAKDEDIAEEWRLKQKLRNDPRVTPIGRFLRRSSLDELPQLWNVLRGDMSLVGPRPMLPDQMPIYPGRAYFRLRPGLTGLWQISSRGQSDFVTRSTFDAIYENEMGLGLDFQIVLRTIAVVYKGTGS